MSSGKPSYFHNPGSEPLKPLTVGQLLDIAAAEWPDRKAVISVHENAEITFAEYKRRADELGAGFLKLGMQPNDRIAIFGGNSINWLVTAMAAAKIGLISTGINPNYEREEILYCLRKIGVKAIVADSKYKNRDYFQLLSEVVPDMMKSPPSSPISSKELPDLKYIIFASEKKFQGSYRYEDLLDSTEAVDEANRRVQPDHPFNIQFTSGTTGTPKAAVISHFAAVNNASFFGRKCGFGDKHSTICVQQPLFHAFGLVIATVAAIDLGSTMVLPGPAFNRYSTVEALSKYKCTDIYGTPTMYLDVCETLKKELVENEVLRATLQYFGTVATSGALCTPQLFSEITQTFNCKAIQNLFGMTESLGVFTNKKNDTPEQRASTVGSVFDHLEVKVVDADGKMVPFGTAGEAWYRGYSTMLGYWDDVERTREVKTPSGWLKSGDQIVLSEDGYGIVVGRLKDQINKGGEKIMPSEIEHLLATHPRIQEVHVHAVSDHRMGEEICACIKLCKGTMLTQEDVRHFCAGKIARFKIPKYIRFMEDFPKTNLGKVQKVILRKRIEEELKTSTADFARENFRNQNGC